MASAAAELFVKVTADIKGLTSGFGAAVGAAKQLGEGIDEAAGHWVDANGRMRDASGKFVSGAKAAGAAATSIGDIMKGVAGGELLADGIRGAANAMVSLGTQSIKLAGELEQNKVAFTTMLGGAKQADAMLRELATFAASTPFELRGLTDSTKKLLAFGFDAKAVIPIMNSVGNAVAAVGGGKETLDGVTMALGQMAAKGKVSAEEMNQLAERGIPAWKMLADGIGVSIPEAMKKAEKGSIDAGTAITALVNGMNTKFPGMMQKQSQTITGALSNLQDSADAALTKIGQKLIETFDLTRVVQQMSAAISNLTAAFTTGGLLGALDKAFGPTTKAAILGIAAALAGPMIASLAGVAAGFATAAAAAAPFIALAAAVAFAAYPIIKNWDGIKGTITALWDTAATYTSAYYNRAVRVVNDLVKMFQSGFGFIGSSIRAVLGDDLTNKLLGGVSKAAGAFRSFAEVAATPLRAVASLGSAAASNFSETWRGAMSMSQGFTSDLFRQAGGAARDFSKTLTADMLGLAKSSAAAAVGAGKAVKAIKDKAHAAREATAATKAASVALNKLAYQSFEATAKAESNLSKALAAVAAEARRQGPAYDEAGGRAEAYARNLQSIEAAWGRGSQRVIEYRQALEAAKKASDEGGAATAAAYRIIAEGSTAFDTAALKAKVLGQDFVATSEHVKQMEADILKMIDAGVKPGIKVFDDTVARLKAMREEIAKQPASLDEMAKAQGDVINSLRDIVTGSFDLAQMVGIQVPQAVKVGAIALIAGAGAVGIMALAVKGLTVAWTTFTAAFATNPIGAALVLAGAAVVGIVAAVQAVRSEQQKAAEEAATAAAAVAAKAQELRDKLVGSIESGLRGAAQAFLAGAEDYREKLRASMREGLIAGVLDAMMKKEMLDGLGQLMDNVVKAAVDPMQAGLENAMKAFVDASEAALTKLEPVLEGLRTQLDVYVPLAVKEADEGAKRIERAAAGGGTGGGGGGMEARNREALVSYQQNLLRTVERLANAGAQDPASRLHNQYLQALDQANKAAADIRGMATGGLVTGPTLARMGEGGRDEAVLPLNDRVFSSIAQGIAAAGASGTQVVINYTGNGKWTREDAQGLGRLLVSELRAMGVR